MTATASTDKSPSAFSHYFFNGIKRNLKIVVVILFLHLLAFPVAITSLTYYTYMENQHDGSVVGMEMTSFFAVIAVLFTAAGVLAGIVISLNNFSYLNKKQNVDMYYAFPLNTRQRFTADYFSGLICYIVPFLAGMAATAAVCAVSEQIIPQWKNAYEFMTLVGFVARCCVLAVVAMIMFYTLSVLVETICGSFFETLFYTFVINCLIPGIIAIISVVIFGNAYGIDVLDVMCPPLAKTSPVGAAIAYVFYLSALDMEAFRWGFVLKFCGWLILFTAIYFAAAYFLYRKRKAEDVSKPFVFKFFYFVIISCITLCIAAIATSNEEFYLPVAVVAVVVYLIMEVVTNRGFRKFKLSLIRCFATVAVCLGLVVISNATDGFGLAYHVPDPSEIKSVSVDFTMNGGLYNYGSYLSDSKNMITLRDKKSIEAVINAQESVLDRYRRFGDEGIFFNSNEYISIRYKTVTGNVIKRSYWFGPDEMKYLYTLQDDPDYASQVTEAYRKELLSNDDYFNITVDTSVTKELFTIYEGSPGTLEQYKKIVNEILDALEKDMSAETSEQVMHPDSLPVAYLYMGYGGFDISIMPYYTNTIDVISKYGFDLNNRSISEQIKNPDANIIDRFTVIKYSPDSEYGEPEKYSEYINAQSYEYYGDWDYVIYYAEKDITADADYAALVKEIISHSVKRYVTTEPLYKINIYGETYSDSFVVPPEYSDKVEKLLTYMTTSESYEDEVYQYYE